MEVAFAFARVLRVYGSPRKMTRAFQLKKKKDRL